MTKIRLVVKRTLALVIIFSVLFFFYSSFQQHWEGIRSQVLKLDYLYLALSFLPIVATYLLPTYGWYLALNTLSQMHPVTFQQSIAIVNTSNLTKYVPGKLWSYALQLYWMANAGFSKSLVVYVNLINLSISILTTLIVGFLCLFASPDVVPRAFTVPALLALLLFDVVFIIFNAPVTNRIIALFNRAFNRDVTYFDIPNRLLIELHLLHGLAAFCLGIGAYLLCYGIGFAISAGNIPLVMASMLISDVIGFLAVIVPGGLGVREGIMYLMLHTSSSGAVSLLLPVASRIVSMLVEVLLGAIALLFLRKFIGAGADKAKAWALK